MPTHPFRKTWVARIYPPAGLIVVDPKGLPPAICKKPGEVIKEVIEEDAF
jgi:hypothetical protein